MTRHDHDELPPSYDAPAAFDDAPAPAPPSRPALPADVQRAQAPLRFERSNSSITEQYLVLVSENKFAPDVYLKTSNAKIDAVVYLEGRVPRTAGIECYTTNAGIKITLADRAEDLAVAIQAKTSNAPVAAFLPLDFDGFLSMATSNSTTTLSDALKANSTIVPNQQGSPSGTVTYRIHPSRADSTSGKARGDEQGGAGDDDCVLTTTNAKVGASYVGDALPVENNKDSSCLVA